MGQFLQQNRAKCWYQGTKASSDRTPNTFRVNDLVFSLMRGPSSRGRGRDRDRAPRIPFPETSRATSKVRSEALTISWAPKLNLNRRKLGKRSRSRRRSGPRKLEVRATVRALGKQRNLNPLLLPHRQRLTEHAIDRGRQTAPHGKHDPMPLTLADHCHSTPRQDLKMRPTIKFDGHKTNSERGIR